MAKIVIGIHGLGNKPPKETLERWWRDAMAEGLTRVGKPPRLPKFRLVYWADVLHNTPLNEEITDPEDPLFLEERFETGLPVTETDDNSVRKKILDIVETQLDRLFLNEDFTINFSKMTDAFIRRYFEDLEAYYRRESLDREDRMCPARTLIRDRLVAILEEHRNDEILLVSHSMGSIIAYDVLAFLRSDIAIHTFVTMGSPLGFPVIQGKIAQEWKGRGATAPKLKSPRGVKKRWINIADLKDRAALVYRLRGNFAPNRWGVLPRDFVVHNDYRFDGRANPHKSFGYLRTAEFARILGWFMEKDRIGPKAAIASGIRRIAGIGRRVGNPPSTGDGKSTEG